MSNFCMKFFVFTLLIWTLRCSSKDNVGEEYSYQSNQRKTLHLRDGRILTAVTSIEIPSGCDKESVKRSNTVKSEKQESEKTGIDGEASSGSTYQPMDEKVAEDTKHLKGTRNSVNNTKIKSKKTKRDDVPITPLFFAELLLNEPGKGIDILMLYAGGFLKYARNRFF
ncbi:hypothetical protein PCYB_147750 [Plasmodium cynomolgi strain B]|uniref:Pv-fam-d protein n=1 Tax=Plasmodium cynomolgi (strain B) TaxID=1120755 RepID=K6VIY0_PLACD|nr:hypothetical protein PCYB_147750 [Plasmodium cynomolgi strain B]GAB69347.1 hypothetical protein PCYB_147750 [Plasmodium cynomolgi strain B]